MKQRMSTADVAGEVACLRQKVMGMRLSNVYDINNKTYMLKLARSGEGGEKVFVVLESGIRVHTTGLALEKNMLPSPHCMKLRKHLRGKRLDDVSQLGVDRVVDFAFGTGQAQYHLLLEMYAQGNIILLDSSYTVLTCLRTHKDESKGFATVPGLVYPVHMIRLYQPVEQDALTGALQQASEKMNLKNLVAQLLAYGPMLSEHCILRAGLQPGRKPSSEPLSGDELTALMTQIRAFDKWLADCKDTAPKGYLLLKSAQGASVRASEDARTRAEGLASGEAGASEVSGGLRGPRCPEGFVYDDFDPLQLEQKAARRALEFETFDAALDEFYSNIEEQRIAQQAEQAKRQALSRVDKVRADHENRLAALERDAAAAEHAAELIEANLDAVNAVITAINTQLAAGMSWTDLERLIAEQRAAGDPLARMVAEVQLEQSRASLLLDDWLNADSSDDDEDLDDCGDDDADEDAASGGGSEEENNARTRPRHGPRRAKRVRVAIDLNVNAYSNAEQYFEHKKGLNDKRARTEAANSKVLKQVQAKTNASLEKTATVSAVHRLRKTHWFEKFNWFVSSEGYLILSGRDAQQNELLVKRYLKRTDLYVHADVHGASSAIIKNHMPHLEVSPITINQAGAYAVCRSKAWDSKIVTSAWWVYANQVSKTAPTGEYLSTGSFIIRGKKTFLPPAQLVMGLGFLFRVEDVDAVRHTNERTVVAQDALAPLFPQDAAESAGDEGDGAGRDEASAEHSARASASQELGAGSVADGSAEPDFGAQAGTDRAGSGVQARLRSESAGSGRIDAQRGEGAANGKAAGTEEGEVGAKGHSDLPRDSGAGASSALDAFLDGSVTVTSTAELLARRYDLYGLQADGSGAGQDGGSGGEQGQRDDDDADAPQRDGEDRGGKRHLSKRERAAMKKGITVEELDAQRAAAAAVADAAATHADSAAGASTSQPRDAAPRSSSGVEAPGGGGEAKRGQRGKAKRRAQRYGDQDDEDAALLAQLNAASGPTKSKAERREARKAKKASKKAAITSALPYNEGLSADAVADTIGRAKQKQHVAELADAGPGAGRAAMAAAGVAEDTSRGRLPPQTSVAGPAADDEEVHIVRPSGASGAVQPADAPAADAQDGVEDASDEEEAEGGGGEEEDGGGAGGAQASELTELALLTGQPCEEDTLLYAVPVCAPYDVLQKFKFKVKLTPGGQKKGKAGRQAVDLLGRAPYCSAREKAILQAVTDNELVSSMLGNVKVFMPGMQKAVQEQKKAKKAGHK